eukprot:gene19599-biopygen20538
MTGRAWPSTPLGNGTLPTSPRGHARATPAPPKPKNAYKPATRPCHARATPAPASCDPWGMSGGSRSPKECWAMPGPSYEHRLSGAGETALPVIPGTLMGPAPPPPQGWENG